MTYRDDTQVLYDMWAIEARAGIGCGRTVEFSRRERAAPESAEIARISRAKRSDACATRSAAWPPSIQTALE